MVLENKVIVSILVGFLMVFAVLFFVGQLTTGKNLSISDTDLTGGATAGDLDSELGLEAWTSPTVIVSIEDTGLTGGALVYNTTPAFIFNYTNSTIPVAPNNDSANCTLYADIPGTDLARVANITGPHVTNHTNYVLIPGIGGPALTGGLAEGVVHWYINCTQYNTTATQALIAANSSSTAIQSFYLKTVEYNLFSATDGVNTLYDSEGDFNGTTGAAGAGFLNATNVTQLTINITAYNVTGAIRNITGVRIYYNSTGGVPNVNYMNVTNLSLVANASSVVFYNYTLNTFLEPARLTTDGAVLSFMIYVYTSSGRQVNFTNDGKYYNITIDGAAPTVTASATPATGTSLTTAFTLSCTATDTVDSSLTEDAMSIVKPSGAIVNPSSTTYVDTGEIGTYTLRCGARDDTGRYTSSSDTFVVSAASSTSSGGSSSGTATVSSTTSVASIAAGGIAQFETAVSKVETIGVTGIDIAVINGANNVIVKVEQVITKPAIVTSDVNGELYKYVQITVTNLGIDNINTAIVKFKVSKAWLTENGFDKADVRLNRWAVEWTSYAATILSEDDQYVYYSANVPGFSYFAISAEKSTSSEQTEIIADEDAIGTESSTLPPEAGSKSNIWIWIFGLAVLAGIGFAIYFVLKKR